MTREEVKQMFIDGGVAEPTKEAIDNFLNKHNAEVQKQKDEANKYKGLADENEALKKQLEDAESTKLTDLEKVQKENEKSQTRIAELEKQIAISERKKALAEKGIVGEQADKLINEKGELDIEVLGQILSEKEAKAKADKEKELLDGTPNPDGKGGSSDDDTDDAFAKEIANSLTVNNDSKEVISKYY